MNQKGLVSIVLVLLIFIVFLICGYVVVIRKLEPITQQKTQLATKVETATQNINLSPNPSSTLDNKKNAQQIMTSDKVHIVSVETLGQIAREQWLIQPPKNFNTKAALQKVQSFVYAFPGYQYQSISVEVTDSKTSYTRNTQEREQAREQGNFIFDIIIHCSLDKLNETDLQMNGNRDVYFFNLLFSEKDGTYTLTNKEFTLHSLSEQMISKAKKIAGVSGNSMSFTTGWLKNTGGEYWYPGTTDGTIYITSTELDGSALELIIKRSKTFYIDIINGHIIKQI